MLKITIIHDPKANVLRAHIDSISRSEKFFKTFDVVASFDVSDLSLFATQL